MCAVSYRLMLWKRHQSVKKPLSLRNDNAKYTLLLNASIFSCIGTSLEYFVYTCEKQVGFFYFCIEKPPKDKKENSVQINSRNIIYRSCHCK